MGGRSSTSVLPLREWVGERSPPAPDALLARIGDTGGVPADAAEALEALLSEACGALRDAISGVGERRGAFRLLEADAYLTYGCEVALRSSEPLRALLGMVRVMAEAPEEE